MPKKSPYPDIVIPEVPIGEYLLSIFQQYGDSIALVDHDRGKTLTYKDICREAKLLASSLTGQGLRKGDRVGILAHDCVEYVVVILAIAASGGVINTCNFQYSEDQILSQFESSEPRFVFVDNQMLEKLQSIYSKQSSSEKIFVIGESEEYISFISLLKGNGVNGSTSNDVSVSIDVKNDLFIIPYSSGTTGRSKGIMHTHYSYLATIAITEFHITMFSDSCAYSEQPMFNSGCIFVLLTCLKRGVKYVFDGKYNIERLFSAMKKHKVTHMISIPNVVMSMLQTPDDDKHSVPSLRYVSCGGSHLAPHFISAFGKRFNVIVMMEYAMTECCISWCNPVICPEGSSGAINPNTTVKVIDLATGQELGPGVEGAILVQGPQKTMGYFKNPETTNSAIDAEGWLNTGDVGRYNNAGFIVLSGRLNEAVRYKGFVIHPLEIESLLLKNPMILDVAVIGVSAGEGRKFLKAFVVKMGNITKDEVKKIVEEELPDYKHLRGGVQFIDAIPRSIAGKNITTEALRGEHKIAIDYWRLYYQVNTTKLIVIIR